MQIKCKIDKQNIIDFNIHQYKSSETMQKRVMISKLIGPMIFFFGMFIATWVTDIPFWYWAVAFVTTSLVWYWVYPKCLEMNIRKNVEKMLAEGDNKVILEESIITLDEHGISKVNYYKESSLKWSSINKINLTNDYIFIYDSAMSAIIIPRDIFLKNEDEQEFINTLNKYFNK